MTTIEANPWAAYEKKGVDVMAHVTSCLDTLNELETTDSNCTAVALSIAHVLKDYGHIYERPGIYTELLARELGDTNNAYKGTFEYATQLVVQLEPLASRGCMQKYNNRGLQGACDVAMCYVGEGKLSGEVCFFESLLGVPGTADHSGSDHYSNAVRKHYEQLAIDIPPTEQTPDEPTSTTKHIDADDDGQRYLF